MLYPLKLIAPLKDYLWGGMKLKSEYNKRTNLTKVAESWELACHRDGMSQIKNGDAKGMTLAEYISEQGEKILGTKAEKFTYFPLLIKFIDAKEDLSIQVHPDNEYALRVEGEYGKTEMWYIADCEPGASLLYGLKDKISTEEFAQHIRDNTLLEVCNRVSVHKGDVFFIDAGTLHAIGKGILITEIQQNSNTTYRVYDYGRIGSDGKSRELHVTKALDVTKLEPTISHGRVQAEINFFTDYEIQLLAACEYFTVYRFDLHGVCTLKASIDSFQSILLLEGEVVLHYGVKKLSVKRGESIFIPAGMGDYQMKGNGSFIFSTL